MADSVSVWSGVEVKGLDRNDLIFYCLRQITVKKWVVDVSKWVWVKINKLKAQLLKSG